MRAMILAAGRGERMGDVTLKTPKPLLRAGNRYLIEYSLYALKKIGVTEIVINVCYLAEQIKQALGNGERYGVDIVYSEEETALETGGGIFKALPLLGPEPFIVRSCDVITDFPMQKFLREPKGLGHIVLVDNPVYRPRGDYGLRDASIYLGADKTYTFASLGVYRPELFATATPGRFRLASLFASEIQQMSAEYFNGFWHNIGSPEDLAILNEHVDKLITLE